MKNILSMAKCSNESNRPKAGLTAKRSNRLFIAGLIALAVSALALTSCEKNEFSTLYGKVDKPAWTAPENPDLATSMTAVIKVLTLEDKVVADSLVTASDVLAAFIDEQCCGIASYEDGLFYLYITEPSSLQGGDKQVSLRFWSAEFTNLFEVRDAFPFVNDTQVGTIADPYLPLLKITK